MVTLFVRHEMDRHIRIDNLGVLIGVCVVAYCL